MCRSGSLRSDDLSDHAGRDGGEHEVSTHADPVVAARRLLQAMAAPVVHHIVAAAVFLRHVAAATPFDMRLRIAAAIEVAAVAIVLAIMAPVAAVIPAIVTTIALLV